MEVSTSRDYLARPLRLGSLFLHFFDIHFIEERGSTASTHAFQNEILTATRIAVAISERVFIPASSYFESHICRSIINDLNDLFELGIIVIAGSSPNLDIFIDEHRESALYRTDSRQHRAYTMAMSDHDQPAYVSRTRSATRDIVQHWSSLVNSDELPKRLFRHQDIQPEIARRLEQVPSELNGLAFIPEHVFSVLDLGSNSAIIQNRIRSTINEAYFGSFTKDLKSGVIEDFNYLSASYAIPSFSTCISYYKMVRHLRQQNRLRELLSCSALMLLQLGEDPVWQKGIINSLLPPCTTGHRSSEISNNIAVSKYCQMEQANLSSDIVESLQNSTFLRPENGLIIIDNREIIMGDQYKVNQAAAVGPGAYAENNTFSQVVIENGQQPDFGELKKQLEQVRLEMAKSAKLPNEFIAIGEVAKAENAIEINDNKSISEHLKSAGKWALDAATQVGASLAAEVIKKSMGL